MGMSCIYAYAYCSKSKGAKPESLGVVFHNWVPNSLSRHDLASLYVVPTYSQQKIQYMLPTNIVSRISESQYAFSPDVKGKQDMYKLPVRFSLLKSIRCV